MGRPVFDHYDVPGERGFGHVLEYSQEHLSWQLEKAGFVESIVDLVEFKHSPHSRSDRVFSALATPIRRVPRLRDNLMVTARNPY
jgi:hypothetical protein